MRNHADYSIVIFPFLKTRQGVSIGHLTFRSTDNKDDLTAEQYKSVEEIASMLFLRDDLRILSASYAIIPYVDLTYRPNNVEHLINVQAVVAYFYASPRHTFGDLFLSSEHASFLIFTPGDVPIHVIRPDSHVELVGEAPELVSDEFGEVSGYEGLYNFRHHFWVTAGSRIYGPKPQMTLNHAQDLSADLTAKSNMRVDYSLLLDLLHRPETSTSDRIFTAIRWFNAANDESSDEPSAVVNLAIAFESLLGLPVNEKTDCLTDAIALLLGRVPRLETWAQKFYDTRSQIVHEGQTQQLLFIANDSRRSVKGPTYQSLLSYGRQIFQLCLGALLAGAQLAEDAGLQEKLITNEERLQRVCKLLADEHIAACDRLTQTESLIDTIEQYRWVPESGLKIKTLIGATRLAVRTLLACDLGISQELREGLEKFCAAKRSEDNFEQLGALRELEKLLPNESRPTEPDHIRAVRKLVEIVWVYVFRYYFRLQQRRSSEGQDQ